MLPFKSVTASSSQTEVDGFSKAKERERERADRERYILPAGQAYISAGGECLD